MQNKPLWLWQRDVLAPYVTEEREYEDWQSAHRYETEPIESFVHKDNLFFNRLLIETFIEKARAGGKPVPKRVARPPNTGSTSPATGKRPAP